MWYTLYKNLCRWFHWVMIIHVDHPQLWCHLCLIPWTQDIVSVLILTKRDSLFTAACKSRSHRSILSFYEVKIPIITSCIITANQNNIHTPPCKTSNLSYTKSKWTINFGSRSIPKCILVKKKKRNTWCRLTHCNLRCRLSVLGLSNLVVGISSSLLADNFEQSGHCLRGHCAA